MLDVNIVSVSIISDELKRLLFRNIFFKIEGGHIYSILGKNGSGKSTLIKVLTNLLPVQDYEVHGKIIFRGIDLLNTEYQKLSQIRMNNVRYVFQDTINSFDPLRKLDYYFCKFAADKIIAEELLQFFLLPAYNKIKELYPYQLSGGMAQRLSLLFALIAEPDLIILDEPTSGIDHAITNLVLLKLKEFAANPNKSVIIVTQDIKFASEASDFISMISDGTLTSFTSKDKFFDASLNEEHKLLIESYREFG